MIGFNNLNKLAYKKMEQDIEEYGENALDYIIIGQSGLYPEDENLFRG